MKPTAFHVRAVEWLRRSQRLSTTVRPGEILEEAPGGGARLCGFFTRPSSAGAWAYSGFCALALGTVLTMLNLPALSPTATVTAHRAGYTCHAAGVGCVVVAELKRRRNRERAVIELRAREAPAPTAESVISLSTEARGARAWLVVEGEVSPEVIATAAGHGVRCFVDADGRFEAVAAEPSATDRPAEEREA